jgi:hypothetical protein
LSRSYNHNYTTSQDHIPDRLVKRVELGIGDADIDNGSFTGGPVLFDEVQRSDQRAGTGFTPLSSTYTMTPGAKKIPIVCIIEEDAFLIDSVLSPRCGWRRVIWLMHAG